MGFLHCFIWPVRCDYLLLIITECSISLTCSVDLFLHDCSWIKFIVTVLWSLSITVSFAYSSDVPWARFEIQLVTYAMHLTAFSIWFYWTVYPTHFSRPPLIFFGLLMHWYSVSNYWIAYLVSFFLCTLYPFDACLILDRTNVSTGVFWCIFRIFKRVLILILFVFLYSESFWICYLFKCLVFCVFCSALYLC